ncbi:MAG: SAM-dependent methyltransferase [Flammeovirgaceae bacterium]
MNIYLIPNFLAENTPSYIPEIVKDTIKKLKYFFVEDERNARRYISSLKLGLTISDMFFFRLDKDTTPEMVRNTFQQIPQNAEIGILSDAGCPGIADPCAVAVGVAHQSGYKVIPLPGPSSILLALMASGLNGQKFAFQGYLPIEKNERIKAIRQLEIESSKKQQTQIFIETPYRNQSLLHDLVSNCMPQTLLCIATLITSPSEFLVTKPVNEWKKALPDIQKKETVFLMLAQ